MNKRIFIREKYEVELYEKPIAIPLTYELIDIKNLNKRTGSKSKTITVPRTEINDKIFGIASDPAAQNQFNKYDFADILITEDSETIFNGLFRLADVTLTEISFFCFAEFSKFKGISGTKRLQDLQLTDLDHLYDITIFDTWSGVYPYGVNPDYFYPVIDYGQFENRVIDPEQIQIFISDLYPGLYLRRAIKQIGFDNGYTIVSSFFDDPIKAKLLLAFCNESFVHDNDYLTSRGFMGNDLSYTVPAPAGQYTIEIDTIIYNDASQFDTVLYEYTANRLQNPYIDFEGSIDINGNPNVLQANLILQKFDSGLASWSDVFSLPYQGTSGPVRLEFHTQQVLQTGDKIRVVIERIFDDVDMLITVDQYKISPFNGLDILPGEVVQMAPNLPDMKQIDLFTYCYKMFNWVVDVDDSEGVIYIEAYDDYYAGNIPVDMSSKMVVSPQPIISYQNEGFSRSYGFEYTHDDEDEYLSIYNGVNLTKERYKFGDGELILSDKDTPVLIGPVGFSPTVIEKTFSPTPYLYLNLPVVWRRDREIGIRNTNITPRILINAGLIAITKLSDGTATEINIESLGPVSQLPLVYFQKIVYNDPVDLFDLNLSFDIPVSPPDANVWNGVGLIKAFYEKPIKNLAGSASLTVWFTLNSRDISGLDFSRYWYLDFYKSFFKVNKILDYQPGSLAPTKVNLVIVGVFYEFTDTFINFESASFRITEDGLVRQLEGGDLRIID